MSEETTAINLTIIEKNNLTELEVIIEKGMKTFYEVGFALMQIRDNRLYRETHRTFEEYCKEKWKFTKSRANQLIAASEVNENLTTIVAKPLNEAQARPLTSLPLEQQREVYQKTVETAPEGKVTARDIKKKIREVKGIEAAKNDEMNDPSYLFERKKWWQQLPLKEKKFVVKSIATFTKKCIIKAKKIANPDVEIDCRKI